MSASVRYQIFVSSTQADLRDEREAIINELNKIGYVAVGMEQFPATDEEQMDFIRPLIDDSDYYVLIVKGRYGSTDSKGTSFTEKEFNYATKTKKPIIAFLFKDVLSLQLRETDNEPEKASRLNAFRAKLESKRIVRYWNTKEELISQVKDSLHALERKRPAVGWVRGDRAIDVNLYKTIENLRNENDSLKRKAAQAIHDVALPSDIAQGQDEIACRYRIVTKKVVNGEVEEVDVRSGEFKTTWDSLLRAFSDEIHSGTSDSAINNRLKAAILNREKLEKDQQLQFVDGSFAKILRYQFEALGLIASTPRIDNSLGMPRTTVTWRFTDKGRLYASRLKAVRRKQQNGGEHEAAPT